MKRIGGAHSPDEIAARRSVQLAIHSAAAVIERVQYTACKTWCLSSGLRRRLQNLSARRRTPATCRSSTAGAAAKPAAHRSSLLLLAQNSSSWAAQNEANQSDALESAKTSRGRARVSPARTRSANELSRAGDNTAHSRDVFKSRCKRHGVVDSRLRVQLMQTCRTQVNPSGT